MRRHSKLILSAVFGCAPLCICMGMAADLTLYTDADFQGLPLNVVIDMRQLDTMRFSDRASSLVIEKGAWILCTDEDFEGRCVTLEPGRYGSLKQLGLDDTVTSVKRRDPVSPGIFSDAQATPAGN